MLATTTTDGNGNYGFDGLRLGQYAVRISPQAMDAVYRDYAMTTDPIPVAALTPAQTRSDSPDIGMRPNTPTAVVMVAYLLTERQTGGTAIRWGTLEEKDTKQFRLSAQLRAAAQARLLWAPWKARAARAGITALLTQKRTHQRLGLLLADRGGKQRARKPVWASAADDNRREVDSLRAAGAALRRAINHASRLTTAHGSWAPRFLAAGVSIGFTLAAPTGASAAPLMSLGTPTPPPQPTEEPTATSAADILASATNGDGSSGHADEHTTPNPATRAA